MPFSIAVLDDYQQVGIALGGFDQLALETRVRSFPEHFESESVLAEALQSFDAVIAIRERTAFPRELLTKLPNLKILVTTGMGNDSIDLDAAADFGVVVAGTGGIPYPTAELTIGLMIDLVRNIALQDQHVRQGGWQAGLGRGLAGKTLGLLGLGRLGSKVASVARAMDMSVVAWSQNLTKDVAEEAGATYLEKDALLEAADVVSIHLRLSERTRGLIGRRELALLGPSSYLINTSRGPIVEEAALIEALEQKAIAGAALDVFDREPLPLDHPLRRLPNTVITPHVGYVTDDTYAIFYRDAREDIAAFLNGEALRVLNG